MSQPLAPADTAAAQMAEIVLTGDLDRPARLTVPDLPAAWPQHEADVSFECATSGIQRHRFTGPGIEHFTGRDLSRLADRRDLWAALLCRS